MHNVPNIHNKNCRFPGVGNASVKSIRNFRSMGCREKEKVLLSMWQEYQVRPGLSVSVLDAALPDTFSFDYRRDNQFIDFGFFLEGDSVNEIRKGPRGNRMVENRAGKGGIGFFKHMNGIVTIPAGKKVRIVHMHVMPEVLGSMLCDDVDCVNPSLRKVLEQEDGAEFFRHHCMSPKVQAVANEVFFGVRNNFGVKLYMEGKTLELLGLSLVEGDCPVKSGLHSLCPRERDIIHAIRKELEETFVVPPSLAELSSKYGISVHKIQAGFRSLYGMSVFGLLKEFKLQKARMLFEEGDMNVSEVAWAIGYINLSHFGTAYRKRFGILPKAYLKAAQANVYDRADGVPGS